MTLYTILYNIFWGCICHAQRGERKPQGGLKGEAVGIDICLVKLMNRLALPGGMRDLSVLQPSAPPTDL